MKSILLWFPCVALSGCGQVSSAHYSMGASNARNYELPANWRTSSVPEFERIADEFSPLTLSDDALNTLGEALADESLVCVRATVLLARSRDPRAKERILVRLEQRVLGSTRESDAGDVVGAAALSTWDLSSTELDRLERLASGDAPHPDLEVRTEIACTLVRNLRNAPIPFLLRVLREGTLDQDEAVEWERKPQMAWAKSRAAETLSVLAGVPCVYQEDGAFHEQATEVSHLEDLLLH